MLPLSTMPHSPTLVNTSKYRQAASRTKIGCSRRILAQSRVQWVSIKHAPVRLLTGKPIVHALHDQCPVLSLQHAGVNVTSTIFADIGIKGNSHFSKLGKISGKIPVDIQP